MSIPHPNIHRQSDEHSDGMVVVPNVALEAVSAVKTVYNASSSDGGASARTARLTSPAELYFPLCGCLNDVELCIEVCCCPACQVARQLRASQGTPYAMHWYHCLLSCVCFPVMVAVVRWRVLQLAAVNECLLATCCTAVFCPCCSAVQTGRELSKLGVPAGTTCWLSSRPVEQQMR